MSEIGSPHTLTLIRNGEPTIVQVTIAEQPVQQDSDRDAPRESSFHRSSQLPERKQP
jgi:hypothetical protein